MKTKLAFWNESHTVSEYYRQAFLYNSELPLLSHIRERLPDVKMLDIGVGTGRTGLYFAPLTSSYVAIDYSAGMVESCKKRLSQLDVAGETKVLEASVLEMPFDDGEFDIVLFSFNGIDTLKIEERILAIKEMQRVCRKGGLVVFSSHNSYYLPHQKKFEFSPHPIRLYHYTRRAIKMAMNNPSPEESPLRQPHAVLRRQLRSVLTLFREAGLPGRGTGGCRPHRRQGVSLRRGHADDH